MSKRGFLMMTDAILAFIIISFSVVVTHQFLLDSVSYETDYLHLITSDAAVLIEESGLSDTQVIINLAPRDVCLSTVIKTYNSDVLISEESLVTNGCPLNYQGSIVISRRTFINKSNNHLIIVRGWYKWLDLGTRGPLSSV